MDQNPEARELNDQMARRREELDALRARGIEPYPHAFERTALSQDVVAGFQDDAAETTVAVAGRIMSLRRMGKASFFNL